MRNASLEGEFFPELKVRTLDGKPFALPRTGTNKSLLFFWTTTCGPCTVEMKRIEASIRDGKLSADRIDAIHVGGSAPEIEAHMFKNGYTFRTYFDPDGSASDQIGISMTPTLFLLSEDRRIVWASSGVGIFDLWRIEDFLDTKSDSTPVRISIEEKSPKK